MNKAKLIKKDSPLQDQVKEQLARKRRARRPRVQSKNTARNAFDVTTEWIRKRREETPSARKAFAALFVEPDPQSV